MDLTAIKNKAVKTAALESAYDSGFTGCFLRNDHGPEGAQARYHADQFRDTVGKSKALFSGVSVWQNNKRSRGFRNVDGCHVYTSLSFEQFAKHNAGYPDTLMKMFQNSGCCVGASWKEMMDELLGKLSADPVTRFLMYCCCSMVVYSYRDGCGQGWYMSACANEALQHGWLPAVVFDGRKLGNLTVPSLNGLQCDDESELERLATSTWCNDRVPDVLEAWMTANFGYNEGAITELDDASESTIKAVCEQQGDFHHGSNYTAGTGGMNTIKRIGGHAQVGYGGDWSPQCLDWFSKLGIKCSPSNFIMPQGQTWGPGWSGEVADSKWPFGSDSQGRVVTQADVNLAARDPNRLQDLLASVANGWGWGPKPEGMWIVTRETFAKYFASETYVYRPMFNAVPGPKDPDVPPPPPPSGITLECHDMRPDIPSPMRGYVTVKAGPEQRDFIFVPDNGRYKAVPKQT